MGSHLPLTSGCVVCAVMGGSDKATSVCGGCKLVAYCGREHQTEDWPDHKHTCSKIKKALRKLQEEETNLRNKPSNMMFQANPFENSVGHFWGILDTRAYMRARFGVADAMMEIDTRQAVTAALNHFMDMLHLNRSDNMGLRGFVPHLQLRLGQDQECYDFLKWWAIAATKSNYDWDDTSLPHLDIKNADAFEEVDGLFVRKYLRPGPCVAILLIKIRLINELKNIQNARKAVGSKLPEEILNQIQTKMVTSNIIANNHIKWVSNDNTYMIETLNKQVEKLFKAIHKANRYLIPALSDPKDWDLSARPEYTSAGDESEMQVVLQQCHKAWWETPGAIEELDGLIAKYLGNAEEWLEEV